VLTATPAVAKKKGKKKGLGPVVTAVAAGNSTSAAGQTSTATATCPAGTVAMGGGFTTQFTSSGALAVDNSFRSSNQSWTASGENVSGAASITTYAYCRRNRKPITDVTAAGVIPSGPFTHGTAAAACPGGTQLISGGYQTTSGPAADAVTFPQVNATTTPGIWTVRSVNNSAGTQTLTAHAYCTTGIKPPKIVTASTSQTVGPFGPVSVTTPACPVPKKKGTKKGKKSALAAAKGKKRKRKPAQLLSAGGFSSPDLVSGSPGAIYVDTRIGSGGGWLGTANNASVATGPLSVTSQGICV
jgi:hypothetical protein